jgi:hypothetical protein
LVHKALVLEDAINCLERGLKAVMNAQRKDGVWSDFNIPRMGPSDAWVTAHVGLRLATLPHPFSRLVPRKELEEAGRFLHSCWRNGWGYNQRSPIDADSTAHGCLFLRAIGANVPSNLPDVLLGFQQLDGGISTFVSQGDLSSKTSWCISHPDVTPVVLRSLIPFCHDSRIKEAVRRAAKRMLSDRLADGSWPAFWWDLRWYTLSQWVQACEAMNVSPPPIVFGKRFEIDQRFNCELDAALLLEAAVRLRSLDLARDLATRLINCQGSTGFWSSAPILRVTSRDVFRPWEVENSGPLYVDTSGVYSAATILSSLALWAAADI